MALKSFLTVGAEHIVNCSTNEQRTPGGPGGGAPRVDSRSREARRQLKRKVNEPVCISTPQSDGSPHRNVNTNHRNTAVGYIFFQQ